MGSGEWTPVVRHLRTLAAAREAEDRSDRELLAAFAVGRDQLAFGTLVKRHGPMVLRVCRHVLQQEQDAEDAFQATFLILARKAGSIRKPGAVPSWLHGVAYRAAMSAKRNAARRRKHEGRAKVGEQPDPSWQVAWREVQALVEEEIARLPDRYRAAFLLCCVEGRSGAETAGQLGINEVTVRTRLSKARRLLQARLARRGVALPTVLATLAVSEAVLTATVSASLFSSTVEGATRFATGQLVRPGLVPASAVALAKGVTRAMLVTRVQIVAVFVLALALAAAGLAVHAQRAGRPAIPEANGNPQPAGESAPSRTAATVDRPTGPFREVFTYAGRVLGPDGRSLAGARVFICGLNPGVIEFRQRAVSGPDGQFRFQVRRDEFGEKGVVPPGRSPPERFVHISATADRCGAANAWAGKPEERESLTLWLPAEEVVRGRVISPEGKPIAGVRVSASIRSMREARDHRPLPFDAPDEPTGFSGNLLPYDWDRTSAVTGADGRFTLRGLGRGWLYDLTIMGPTVVNAKAQIVARPEKPAVVPASGEAPPDRPPPQLPRYGSTFTYVATPCKPIVGVVREKGSGKPLAGVEVTRAWTRDDDPQAWATTDRDGRYRLTGLPAGAHTLKVRPPSNAPYLTTEVRVPAGQPGLAPVRLDIDVERQPAVTGRVIDRATGKPVARCWVEYRPLARNPNLRSNTLLSEPRWGNHPPSAQTDRDGRFLLPALRGPGVLLVSAESNYLPAQLEKSDRAVGVADASDPALIDCRPLLAWPGDFHAYRVIEVSDGKDAEATLALQPGVRRSLVVEFPDEKARDTRVLGLRPLAQDRGGDPYEAGKSAVEGLAPSEARRLFLSTDDGQFAASTVIRAGDSGPVTVRLKPTGTITGRVVDREGNPLSGVQFQLFFDDEPGRASVFVHSGTILRARTALERKRFPRTHGYYDDFLPVSLSEQTDGRGRFSISGLLPDVTFDLKAQLVGPPDARGARSLRGELTLARPTVKPGQTLDLGDLRAEK